jgi:hypothetical protein
VRSTQSYNAPKLRAAAADAANDLLERRSEFVLPPLFAEKDGVLSYSLGAVIEEGLSAKPDDEFARAVTATLRVKMLSELFERVGRTDDWQPRASRLDSAMTELVTAHGDPERTEAMRSWEKEFDEAVQRLVGHLGDYAAERQLAVRRVDAGVAVRGFGFAVKLATDPQGGRVRMLLYLEYRRGLYLGKALSEMPWISYPSPTAQLMGRYRYWVTWAGRKATTGTIEVSAPTELTFTPD